MKRKTCLLIIAYSLLSLKLSAQMSLEQCRSLAKEHYPAIRQYELVQKTGELSLSNASKAYLPQIVIGAQATWQNAVASFPEQLTSMLTGSGMDFPGIRKEQYQISVQIEQTIWDGGRTKAEKEISKAAAASSAGALDVDFEKLESRVDELFFGILMLNSRERQAESMNALLESNLSRLRALRDNGAALTADCDRLEAELLSGMENLALIQGNSQYYKTALSLFTGVQVDSLLKPKMPAGSEGIRSKAELRLIDSGILGLEAQEKLVKSATMPRFSIFAQSWYGYPGLDMFRSMTSSDPTFNAILGVRMSWNISAFYTKGNTLHKIRVSKAESEVKRELYDFNNSIRLAGNNSTMDRLNGTVERSRKILELRKGIRESAEVRYENGVMSLTELLNAISEENAAGIACEAAELELLKTAYELEKVK